MDDETNKNICKKGYEKLAFGSINDVVKLMLLDKEVLEAEIEKLDLFNISKIQKKGDMVSVDIFNRQEALDRLQEMEKESKNDKMMLNFLGK